MDALCPPLLPCFMEELWVDWRMKVCIKENRVKWNRLVFVVGAPREKETKKCLGWTQLSQRSCHKMSSSS